MASLPTFDDVRAAAGRIAGVAHRTPVMTSRFIDDAVGARIFFKCENLQRMGAFKFRGAYNALSRFTPEQKRAGVLTYSSGNHAQAIALAARELGIPATIVMPDDAPALKVTATEGYGGRVVRYDRYTEDREAIGRRLAEEQGLTVIPPFDHPDVVTGQGTAALELIEDVGELDVVVTPLGGGGLLSGTALTVRALLPKAEIYGVEPEAGNDGQQSFRRGEIVKIDVPRTIADGAQTQALAPLTFDIIRRDVTDIWTATDDQLRAEIRTFATRLKLVVEPTGALAMAAVRAQRERLAGKRVGVIISGGNIDPAHLASILSMSEEG